MVKKTSTISKKNETKHILRAQNLSVDETLSDSFSFVLDKFENGLSAGSATISIIAPKENITRIIESLNSQASKLDSREIFFVLTDPRDASFLEESCASQASAETLSSADNNRANTPEPATTDASSAPSPEGSPKQDPAQKPFQFTEEERACLLAVSEIPSGVPPLVIFNEISKVVPLFSIRYRRGARHFLLRTRSLEDSIKVLNTRIVVEGASVAIEMSNIRNEQKVYIGNLPNKLEKTTVKEHFQKYGRVLTVEFPGERKMKAESQESPSFGFVIFAKREEAESALKDENHLLNNERIKVELAASKNR